MFKVNKVKPLDELFKDNINEFESGVEKEQEKGLDGMIWELGSYESKEPPQASEEFKEEGQIEDELAEKPVRGRAKKLRKAKKRLMLPPLLHPGP